MGRQSARIYFNGQDHKEMVTWDGTQYVYHDKAYIWNGSDYELVWEKLYGLKLLYDGLLPIDPVSSENNKYIYFTENSDGSVIYRIKVNDKEPEREEQWTSDKYDYFTAPRSSRGFGVYAQRNQYGYSYDYQVLNLEDGTVYKSDHFDASEYLWSPTSFGPPTLTNQEVSPAESGLDHNYMSIFGGYLAAYVQEWNFVYFIAPTGISAMQLDNYSGTVINGYFWDLGRLNDGGPRGLMPRFLRMVQDGSDDVVSVIEYGAGTSHGMYSVTFYETLPFTIPRSVGGGWNSSCIKVVRDKKLPILASDNHIWFIKANTDDFEFIDTEIESPSRYSVFDVSPDYKYAMIFEDWNFSSGTKIIKIVDISTGKLIVNVTDEIGDLQTTNAFFVGHKCLFVTGYYRDTWTVKYRLYKWR